MEIKIINENENALFNRKEIFGEIGAEVIPSNIEVAKALAENFSASEEAITIKKIVGKFGSKVFSVDANIYNSKEDKDKAEPSKKEASKEGEFVATEAPAETPKEETKIEENKSEEVKQ
jgi:ribosomal protein S24E